MHQPAYDNGHKGPSFCLHAHLSPSTNTKGHTSNVENVRIIPTILELQKKTKILKMDAGRLVECRMLVKTGRGLPAAVDSVASTSVPSFRLTPFHMWTTLSSPCFLTMAAKFLHYFARLKEKGWNIYYIPP